MSIMYKKSIPSWWLEEATKKIDRKRDEFVFYILTFNEDIYPIEDSNKSSILEMIESEKKSVFLIEMGPEELQMMDRVAIPVQFTKESKFGKGYEGLWFKRPFFFDFYDTTGLIIVQKVLRYLYNEAYNKSSRRRQGVGIWSVSFDEYYEKMMDARPFNLILKKKKVIERYYQKVETHF